MRSTKALLKPEALQKGDTIAVIRPSSRMEEGKLNKAISELRKQGFCVVTYPGRTKKDSYFAASDEDRAKEFHWAMCQPGVKAVLCSRGGYGAVRLVSQISPERMKIWKRLSKQPKLFVGYSDSTYLHQWLQNETKAVTIHGPLLGFLDGPRTKKFVRDLLSLPKKSNLETWTEVKVLRAGRARGRLVGGNLTLLDLYGRAALPKVPVILAIEDVQEHHYRLDRYLWRLIDGGYGKYVKGVIVGNFLNCGEKDKRMMPLSRVYETILKLTNGPVWTNARFGHGVKHQRLLPLGCKVEMRGKKFHTLEGVVR